MKNDELSRIKYIGPARVGMLNQNGITTVDQLHLLALEELAEIKFFGGHYARLIKDAVTEYCAVGDKPLPDETLSADETLSVKDRKNREFNRDFRKQLKRLKKRQKRLNEDLKPLWKKKYLPLYLKFKKRSNKLKGRIGKIEQVHQELPKKDKKKIIKQASALRATLKNAGNKPKTKNYVKITQQLESFSTMLRDVRRSLN